MGQPGPVRCWVSEMRPRSGGRRRDSLSLEMEQEYWRTLLCRIRRSCCTPVPAPSLSLSLDTALGILILPNAFG